MTVTTEEKKMMAKTAERRRRMVRGKASIVVKRKWVCVVRAKEKQEQE